MLSRAYPSWTECSLLSVRTKRPAATRMRREIAICTTTRTWRAHHVLVVVQIAISLLILVAAGLFVRTLNKLHSVQLGYARESILLFSLNARQAGHRGPEIATFYADLRKRFESIPGMSSATLSQSSIIRAGHARGTMKVGAVAVEGTRVL